MSENTLKSITNQTAPTKAQISVGENPIFSEPICIGRLHIKDLDSSSNTGTTAGQSQMSNSNHSLTYIGIQIRKAVAAAAIPTYTDTDKLSYLSHLSNPPQPADCPTAESITRFYHDDPESIYRPLPPHKLDDSPSKPIIRTDNHSFYYCTLHPEVRSVHLDSIEHHCRFKDPEMHESEILKSLSA